VLNVPVETKETELNYDIIGVNHSERELNQICFISADVWPCIKDIHSTLS
jgi:dihydroneopterin aldolase